MSLADSLRLATVVAALALALPALANTVMVGGQPMYPNKTIVENAVNSADHTTLVAAVKAANLVDTLQGPGPFTVFAPVNSAFAAVPAGTVDTLLKPENKDMLVKVLTYHVVPGRITHDDLKDWVKQGGGRRHGHTENRLRRNAHSDVERSFQHRHQGLKGRCRRHHHLRRSAIEWR